MHDSHDSQVHEKKAQEKKTRQCNYIAVIYLNVISLMYPITIGHEY
jgi:hypothetical protein